MTRNRDPVFVVFDRDTAGYDPELTLFDNRDAAEQFAALDGDFTVRPYTVHSEVPEWAGENDQ